MSGLRLNPVQECRAGDRSYAREMQQKVVEDVIVKVRYCWVRVYCWGHRKDVCLESTVGRGGEVYLICICVIWYRAGIYSCHQQCMYWAPPPLSLASAMAGHCQYLRKADLGIPETINIQPWLWVASPRKTKTKTGTMRFCCYWFFIKCV